MKKAIHFGAGNIGRGFLGQLYFESDYETVFVDIDAEIIDALNSRRSYEIEIRGENIYKIPINNVRAVDARDTETVATEISDADILSTAVGVNVLPHIAPTLATGLSKRADVNGAPINIIVCENLLNAGAVLKSLILECIQREHVPYLEQSVGFVDTVISRMVPVAPEDKREQDPLYIAVEEYHRLPVNGSAFVGNIPNIKGMEPYDNLIAYEERKLFTHNCGHALCAYFGYQKGYTYIWEAVLDEQIRKDTLKGLWESGEALIQKYRFTRQEHEAHINDLLKRFANKALGDTIARVGRDPIRKLGAKDRLVGAANLALDFGIEPKNLVKGITAALSYNNPLDEKAVELSNMLREMGLEYVLKEVCELKPTDKLFEMIVMEITLNSSA